MAMHNVGKLPSSTRILSEYEALLTAAPAALEAIPSAAYVCDHTGLLVCYNAEAAALWGRTPDLESGCERFCGAHRLCSVDGTAIDHAEGPVAEVLRSGTTQKNVVLSLERPDGSAFPVLVNARALKDSAGRVQGAINCFQEIAAESYVQRQVQQKNQDLEDFFENSAIGLHIVSGEGVIQRANKAELHLLGYAAEEYVGRHIAEFHADAPVIGDILQRLACGQRLDRYPARLRAKDGSIKHVLITSNSRFEDGRFINTRCFTMDVTRLQEAEAARHESEERLAATHEAAPVGIAEADENGDLLRVNNALCAITGRTREELLSISFLDYTHQADRKEDAELYARQVRGELANYTIRKRVVRPDGAVQYVDVLSSSVRDAAGKFRYGVRVTQDVTESKYLEDRIRRSEQHMRDLLEALPIAVYTTDAQGRINFFNKACIAMAGRTPELGEEWCVTWRLYAADGTPLPHSECPMATALKENRAVRGVEAIAERPDGTMVPFIPYPTPLHDAEGKLIGAINMLVDITERKMAENRQKVLIDELNHRVKNTLATVQSLAGQTAHHAATKDAFLETFERRLMALARAHDLLTVRHWENAPFDKLIHDVLVPLTGEQEQRVRFEGPAVEVDARTVLGFTLTLNELATNATKYGALSVPTGSLSISWSVLDHDGTKTLELHWREYGGPAVVAPRRRGFGSRLMERCVEGDLAGNFDLVFEADGVRCSISVPLRDTRRHEPLSSPRIAALARP
jgi:PAS domain S-box-containing protein